MRNCVQKRQSRAKRSASENELNGHAHTYTHKHTLAAHSDCCCRAGDALIAKQVAGQVYGQGKRGQNSIGQSSTWPEFFDRVTPTFSRVLQTYLPGYSCVCVYRSVCVCVRRATFAFTFAMPTIFSFNSACNF